ncbi:DNA-binding transcriptional MerR regulator [Paenibacillus qinlingensis]|uniref:DNA-binding transcriptional MerR regulator n=1 Tax=Paenibacillus qinlingensis TaxID=1837343 RepID=A0ABU1NXL6_9BACL|nr:MerR family transcriptional regulator [Paenibacillus qinlingensis]MDR6551811.1 DNA-binding transcriptional MerR regulator [Paenibacillus qinlingensis]
MKTELTFTIKQTAEKTGISEDTIRYYEKIALLPRAERKDNGHRIYRQEDIDTIHLIYCLKKTGMPLEEMRPFLTVSVDADPAKVRGETKLKPVSPVEISYFPSAKEDKSPTSVR